MVRNYRLQGTVDLTGLTKDCGFNWEHGTVDLTGNTGLWIELGTRDCGFNWVNQGLWI